MEEKISISLTSEQIDKFYNNIKIDEQTGCHIYTGSRDKHNYGVVNMKFKKFFAHRIAWLLFYRDLPKEMCVCHKCDNPSCCNPEHLFLGTQADNIRDMVNKNRNFFAFGEKSGNAQLTEYQVVEIFYNCYINKYPYGYITYIAKKYNVCRDTIYDIINGRTWKHLSA